MSNGYQPPPIEPPPGSPLPPQQETARPQLPVPPADVSPAENRAIASMVLGIVSIVLGCIPLVGLICGTIAIVLYVRFISDFNTSGERLGGRGLAIAGLVCGIIGTVIGAIYAVYWVVMVLFLGSTAGMFF
ncbi:MAG: DUF4190 domain-containing protein [Deltaproteobacteria bacterium]|nr:DUF4190 domain-containing protein [Deltaproteobacteria bacterium]